VLGLLLSDRLPWDVTAAVIGLSFQYRALESKKDKHCQGGGVASVVLVVFRELCASSE